MKYISSNIVDGYILMLIALLLCALYILTAYICDTFGIPNSRKLNILLNAILMSAILSFVSGILVFINSM